MITSVKRKPKEQRMADCLKNMAALECFLNVRSVLVKKKIAEGDRDGIISGKISSVNRQILYLLGISDGQDLAEGGEA